MGLEYRLKMKDAVGEANSYSNMANLYAKMRDTTQSLVYYEKAISLARLLKNEELISGNLGNMANIYMGKFKFIYQLQKGTGAVNRIQIFPL